MIKMNMPVLDLPFGHFILRPSFAVPRPDIFQTASANVAPLGVQMLVVVKRQPVNHLIRRLP